MLGGLPLVVQAQDRDKTHADLKAYLDRMKVMIKRHWYPPKSTKVSHTVVSYGLDASGQAHDIRVLISSGDAVKDVAAMEAIKATVPFEALPKQGPSSVDVEFAFDYDPKLGKKSHATYKPSAEDKQH